MPLQICSNSMEVRLLQFHAVRGKLLKSTVPIVLKIPCTFRSPHGMVVAMTRQSFLRLSILIAVGTLSVAGCGKNPSAAPAPKPKSVALVFPVMVDAFTEFRQEFEAELQPEGVKVASFSAEGSPDRFAPSVKAGLLGHPDVLVTIGTQVTNVAFSPQFEADLPKVIASCISAPEKVEALTRIGLTPPRKLQVAIVSDSPKTDVYGMATTAIESVLGPGLKKIGVLFNEAEINSKNTAAQATGPLAAKGHEIVNGPLTGPADLEAACKALLLKGVDLIIIPHDKVAVARAETVVKLASENPGKPVPVFALDDGTVKNKGAHFGVSVNYGLLGRMTAKLCREILAGKSPADEPIIAQESATICFNKAAMERGGLKIPEQFAAAGTIFPGK